METETSLQQQPPISKPRYDDFKEDLETRHDFSAEDCQWVGEQIDAISTSVELHDKLVSWLMEKGGQGSKIEASKTNRLLKGKKGGGKC
jgi:hypothetical protein